jgi:hypothetical protein
VSRGDIYEFGWNRWRGGGGDMTGSGVFLGGISYATTANRA